MTVHDRIRRYKETGGAADLTRVEVLVPPEARDRVLDLAARLRREHRVAKAARTINAERVNDRAKLIMHRLLARRIGENPDLIGQAKKAVAEAKRRGKSTGHLDEWAILLSRDPVIVRRKLTERSDEMTRLRVSSPLAPLAGIEDPEQRKRIWRKARRGIALRTASNPPSSGGPKPS